jgi:short-subunit dehydrogenase
MDGKVRMLQLDASSDESAQGCVTALLDREGRLDLLVNSAGTVFVGGEEETSLDEAKEHFETNFFGAVRMTKLALPTMRRQMKGKVINMGSIAGKIGCRSRGSTAPRQRSRHARTL